MTIERPEQDNEERPPEAEDGLVPDDDDIEPDEVVPDMGDADGRDEAERNEGDGTDT